MLGRSARLRCPRCGSGGLFAHWMRLRDKCPHCGLVLSRGERDHWLGAFAVNLVAAELIGVGIVVAIMLATAPRVPWTMLQWGAPLLMLLLPFAFFPFSRTLWLAFDLYFRPVRD
jgi:uncharacterized protein (DUF983 family)